jgi:cytoskeletal protein CcmA (bactofilin family)
MADAIDQSVYSRGEFRLMAWFDRGFGEKKGGDITPSKLASKVEPIRAADAAPPAPQLHVVTPQAEPAPAGREPELVGYLYKGSRVSGQLFFQGAARIDGNVEGEIQCQGTLTIGDGAEVRARVFSQVVIIRGKVEGNVIAKEKIELVAPGRVIGNISAPRLTVTEGVVFDGDCSMGSLKQKSGVVSSQAVSSDKAAPAQQSDSHK